jgi:hypothetical protein
MSPVGGLGDYALYEYMQCMLVSCILADYDALPHDFVLQRFYDNPTICVVLA